MQFTIYVCNTCNCLVISQKNVLYNCNVATMQLQLQRHVDIAFHPSMVMISVHFCGNSFVITSAMITHYEMELHCHLVTTNLCTL
jgi:hypothetical protein